MMEHLRQSRQLPFLWLIILLLAGMLLVPGGWQTKAAWAQTALTATQDTFVDPNNDTTNYDGKRLELTYSNFQTLVGTRRVLLQFDLRGVSSALTAAPLVLTAVENNFQAGATLTLGLYGLPDTWTEAAVTSATQPAVGAKLQSVTVAAGRTGAVRFDAAAVGAYLEGQRTGDGVASFLLQLDEGSGTLGFGGNLFFEDSEGSSNGVNGDEPIVDTPTAPTATPTNTPVTPTATPTNTPVTPTATPTNTPVTPTATPTNTPVTPTATNTPVTPTATPTNTPVTPTATNTPEAPTATPTNTTEAPTATATNTPVTPTATPTNTPEAPTATATNTPVTPTATPTNTTEAPTATPTNTPVTPTATPTNTTEAPTATATNTPVTPTATPTNTTEAPTATPTNTPVTPTATPTNTTEAPTATPTNTTEAPTATPTNTPEPPTATATNTPEAPTATPTVPPVGETVYYLGSNENGTVGGVDYRDEDIVRYSETEGWQMVFDGSDVGLKKNELDDFAFLSDGSILMSFAKPMKLPGLGLADERLDDADIVRFVPTSLGVNTSGTFSLYFDGSDVGLTTGNEDIDALSVDGAGNLILSTAGSFSVEGVKGRDEDLLKFIPTSLGANTAGRWELFFDGSTVDLTASSEDVNALWLDPSLGTLYLSTKGDFQASGNQTRIAGDRNDLFGCTRVGASCDFFAAFDGDLVGFKKRINGVSLDLTGASIPWASAVAAGGELPDPLTQYEVLPDAPVDADDQYDAFDQVVDEDDAVLSNQLFLPLIKR